MNILQIIAALVCAYLIGSFPSAYIVARLRRGIDIRREGSHNMGAMNVFYRVGFAEGMMVLALDIGKGAAGVALARFIGVNEIFQFIAAAMIIVGHNFPIFLGFRGGKGGASVIGILAYFMPWGIPLYLGLFGLLLLVTRYPTMSYSLAFIGYPFIGWLVYDSLAYVLLTLSLLLFLSLRYIPRVIEMRRHGGSWRHVVHRKGLKDRL